MSDSPSVQVALALAVATGALANGALANGALATGALATGAGCASSRVGGSPATWTPPTRTELGEVHARLTALRAQLSTRTEELRIALEAPLLPGEVRARGAVAAAPGRAVRMILVGPGGSTAADLWLDSRGHRLSLPAREEVVRGRRGESLPLVPVELLRAWYLEPLAGSLLDASLDPDGARAVLKTPDAIVFVTLPRDGSVILERSRPGSSGAGADGADIERITSPSGGACGTVVYERPRTGVRAEIVCEKRRPDVTERALVDPDAAARDASPRGER